MSESSLYSRLCNAQRCPNCPDRGWYVVANRNTGEPEQEQCEYCYTVPDSLFNVIQSTDGIEESESRRKELYRALSDLLEQIECLDGIEYTKDLDRYKAEAIWDDVIRQAQDALSKETK